MLHRNEERLTVLDWQGHAYLQVTCSKAPCVGLQFIRLALDVVLLWDAANTGSGLSHAALRCQSGSGHQRQPQHLFEDNGIQILQCQRHQTALYVWGGSSRANAAG